MQVYQQPNQSNFDLTKQTKTLTFERAKKRKSLYFLNYFKHTRDVRRALEIVRNSGRRSEWRVLRPRKRVWQRRHHRHGNWHGFILQCSWFATAIDEVRQIDVVVCIEITLIFERLARCIIRMDCLLIDCLVVHLFWLCSKFAKTWQKLENFFSFFLKNAPKNSQTQPNDVKSWSQNFFRWRWPTGVTFNWRSRRPIVARRHRWCRQHG